MGKSTIPHPPRRVPLIGDVFGMDQETPNQTTLKRFEELGPIYRRSILGTDLTFVVQPSSLHRSSTTPPGEARRPSPGAPPSAGR